MLTALSCSSSIKLYKTNPQDTPTRKLSTPTKGKFTTLSQSLCNKCSKSTTGEGKTKREFPGRTLQNVPNSTPLLTGATGDEQRRRACEGREWRLGKRATTTKATGGSGHPAPPPPQLSLSPTHTYTRTPHALPCSSSARTPAAAASQSCNLPISVNGFL